MTESTSTAAELLREARHLLNDAGVETPGLDAEVLLRHTLQLSREALYLRLPEPVSHDVALAFRSKVEQRLAGVPVAYITGVREFYGREFEVNPSVLIPRPETEHLVELSVQWLEEHGSRRRTVVDVGTGSGAIAVSIANETDGAHFVVGSDVSLDALKVARKNRRRHNASVNLVAGSLLDWCQKTIDVIAVNLPYLRPDQAHGGIRYEPEIALFARSDGFALNGELINQASDALNRPGLLVMEFDPSQVDLAKDVAARHFPEEDITVENDLADLSRTLVIRRE
jgi:release factor glutamine methyltransferase